MRPKISPLYATIKTAIAGLTSRAAPTVEVNKVGYTAQVSMVRPTNTTQYSGGDAIGRADTTTPANAGSAVIEFADIGPIGGLVRFVGADLRIDVASLPANIGAFTLHLFDSAPAAILDNAVFDPVTNDAERAKYLGFINVGTPVDIGSSQFVQNDALAKQVKLAEGSTSLFGVLVGAGTDSPAASTKYTVRVQTKGEC